ncbi:MAG: bifunctional UDP-N-acetylglucosamine diphosphorylase/glucosamine-1-phosphate N-acetyltransferase GlmU [Culicoidibacterales bacterium]
MMNNAIILAAGKGTRMKSKTPKVLHEILGQTMLEHVLQTLTEADVHKPVVVIGHGAEAVKQTLASQDVETVMQKEQLGTGHAVMQAKANFADEKGTILVALGDTPLLRAKTVRDFMDFHIANKAAITVLTTKLEDPTGYGRIIRDRANAFVKIVEQKDGSEAELAVNEVNSGLMCFDNEQLWKYIDQLSTDNAQGEYYLTDLIRLMGEDDLKVEAYCIDDSDEVFGVNDRKMLAYATRVMQNRINEQWMLEGVTFENSDTVLIGRNVKIGNDVVIEQNVKILGESQIAEDAVIGANSVLVNTIVGANTQVIQSRITDSVIGLNTQVGPFAHLRDGNVIGDDVRLGNFVEVKKATIGNETKSAHLTYIGDAVVGERTNFGCGTITVNYDGYNKSTTEIGSDVFIGCNSNLIAPIKISNNTIIAAGTTVTQDVPENALAVGRAKQENKAGYASKIRATQQAKKNK